MSYLESVLTSISISVLKLQFEVHRSNQFFCQGSSTAEIEWLEWVGKLAFTIEREKKIKNLAEITVDGVISFNNNDQVKSDNEEEIEEVEEHVWENLDDVKWQLGKTVYCAQKHAWIHKVNFQIPRFHFVEFL